MYYYATLWSVRVTTVRKKTQQCVPFVSLTCTSPSKINIEKIKTDTQQCVLFSIVDELKTFSAVQTSSSILTAEYHSTKNDLCRRQQ
jgi:hypothetical protein